MTNGPVVVVTGASAGLGRAIAHAYAKQGARLGLIARNPKALDAARQECEQFGGVAITLTLDISDAERWKPPPLGRRASWDRSISGSTMRW